MSFEQLLNNLNPQIVASLRRAIELGKWPNGVVITADQRSLCAEAVASWEAQNLPKEQQLGYVAPKTSKDPCSAKKGDEQPLSWV
ncbi:DUF1315 family protein [Microbulbifer sp. PSTR4-B]|uniref:DUF1315 family protein n=1 Tax=Microbulbifer sp. PSTR4-B TaxID=3243396 RepID=UPI004039ABE3